MLELRHICSRSISNKKWLLSRDIVKVFRFADSSKKRPQNFADNPGKGNDLALILQSSKSGLSKCVPSNPSGITAKIFVDMII